MKKFDGAKLIARKSTVGKIFLIQVEGSFLLATTRITFQIYEYGNRIYGWL